MNEPINTPIPSPSGKPCFNCGKDLENQATFCPHCGAPLPTQGSGVTIALRIIGLIILVGLALLFGAAGACFMLVSGSGGMAFGNANSESLSMAFVGLSLFGAAALCVWGAIRLSKKR